MAGKGRTPWFGPHKIGIGWGPVTWQGYLTCIVVAVAFGLLIHFLRSR